MVPEVDMGGDKAEDKKEDGKKDDAEAAKWASQWSINVDPSVPNSSGILSCWWVVYRYISYIFQIPIAWTLTLLFKNIENNNISYMH